jgi:hypothetical protein
MDYSKDLSQAFYRSRFPELLETFRNSSKTFREGGSESYTYYMYEQYPNVEDVRTYFSYEPNTINTFKLTSSDTINLLESFLVIKAPTFGTPNHSYIVSSFSANVDGGAISSTHNHEYFESESEDIKMDVEGLLNLYDDYEGQAYTDKQFVSDEEQIIDWFLDIKTYSEIVKFKNIKISNFVQDASLRYFNKWLFILDKIPHGVTLLNLYLTINCYVLGINVTDEIKESPFEKDNIDNNFKDKYNSYVEETSYMRNDLINKIRLAIGKF